MRISHPRGASDALAAYLYLTEESDGQTPRVVVERQVVDEVGQLVGLRRTSPQQPFSDRIAFGLVAARVAPSRLRTGEGRRLAPCGGAGCDSSLSSRQVPDQEGTSPGSSGQPTPPEECGERGPVGAPLCN